MEYCYAVASDELKHHGVKGMHWGIRRYQPYPKGTKARKAQKSVEKTLKRSKDWYNARDKLRSNKYVDAISKDPEINKLNAKYEKASMKAWKENSKIGKYDKNGNPGKPTKASIDADIDAAAAYSTYKKAIYKKVDSLIGDMGQQSLNTLYKKHEKEYGFIEDKLVRDLVKSAVTKSIYEGGSPKELKYVHIWDSDIKRNRR